MQEQKSATVTMAYPPRPASPTLTNPDMILPYGLEPYSAYNGEIPNPSQYPEKLAPGQWDNSQNMAGFASYGQGMQAQMMPMAIGGPVTPIIYGNGTMLSDIGEVTEAESVHGSAKKPTRQELRRSRDSVIHNPRGADMAINVSPTKSYGAVMKRSKTGTHERKVSVESTSTVQSEGHKAEVIEGDFDDGISVDDSVFQGDDEESNVDEAYLQELRNRHGVVTIEDTDDEDPLSSAALSRRAERILANAKRRLDVSTLARGGPAEFVEKADLAEIRIWRAILAGQELCTLRRQARCRHNPRQPPHCNTNTNNRQRIDEFMP